MNVSKSSIATPLVSTAVEEETSVLAEATARRDEEVPEIPLSLPKYFDDLPLMTFRSGPPKDALRMRFPLETTLGANRVGGGESALATCIAPSRVARERRNHDAIRSMMSWKILAPARSAAKVVARANSLSPPRARPAMPGPPKETRGQRWFRSYKTFVRRNRALLTAVEQGAAGLTWLVPDGDHTEILAEAASSFVGVVSTLNDHWVGDTDEGLHVDESTSDYEDALDELHSGDVSQADLDDDEHGETKGSNSFEDSARNSEFEEFEDDRNAANVSASTSEANHNSSNPNPKTLTETLAQTLKKWDTRTTSFLEAVPVPLMLGILSQVEVLNEMLAKRRVRNDSRITRDDEALSSVIALETIRAVLKATLWSRQNGKLLVDDGLSPDQLGEEHSNVARDDESKNSLHGISSDLPPGERRAALALNALYQFRLRARTQKTAREESEMLKQRMEEGESGESEVIGDGVDAIETLTTSPNQIKIIKSGTLGLSDVPTGIDLAPPPPLPPVGLTLVDALREDRARLTLKLFGESCHILRPLIYASSMKRHGRKSWRPVLVSASLDVTMFLCLSAAAGQDEQRFSVREQMELKRRRASMVYYLMRSPVFERLTLPALKGGGFFLKPVPLIGGLYQKGVDIAEDVNDHFAYTY